MQEKGKKVLYGRLVYAEEDIAHFSRLYTPYNAFTISSEDFSKETINFYGTEVPLFSKKDVKKGNIIGAVFKDDVTTISKSLKECHPVSDEEDKKLATNGQKTLFTEEEIKSAKATNENASSPSTYRNFTKSYEYRLKDKNEPYKGQVVSVDKIYKYNSLYYESNYIELITAEYDDEEESLTLTLKTEDSNLIAMALSDILGIQVKNIKVIPLPYTTHFDEYSISMVKAAIVAAKAAEKYGETIKLLVRPRSISPTFVIRRKTFLSEDYSRILSENIVVDGYLGNMSILEDDIADTLVVGLIPSYAPEKLRITINFHESSNECTLFFGSFFKAVASSSTMEHTYALSFSIDKQPINLIEEHLEDELSENASGLSIYSQNAIKKHFASLMTDEDAYTQSTIYAVNSKKISSFMSPISAINKAQSVTLSFIQNGLTKQFEKKYGFGLIANRENDGDMKFYIGTPTSEENKERMEEFSKGIEVNEKKADVGFLPRGYRGRMFSAGPDILSRHTSVILNKVKDIYDDETDTSSSSFHQFYQGAKTGAYGTVIWGMGVLSGYRDYVSNEVVITKAHFVLPHSSSFSKDDDVTYYKRKIMNILTLFGVRFREEFDYSDSLRVEFVMREPIFDSIECLFPLVLSAYRILLFELSSENKKLPVVREQVKTKEEVQPQETTEEVKQ